MRRVETRNRTQDSGLIGQRATDRVLMTKMVCRLYCGDRGLYTRVEDDVPAMRTGQTQAQTKTDRQLDGRPIGK